MRLHAIVLCALATTLAGVTSAQAQVFVDPDSPSAKEYAIPLEDARADAAPNVSEAPRSSHGAVAQSERTPAPLFGSGIKPDRTRRSARRRARTSAEARGAKRDRSAPTELRRPSTKADDSAVVQAAIERPGAPQNGPGAGLASVAVAAAVLAAGLAFGLLLRRRRRRP